jgi:hypothetical protein
LSAISAALDAAPQKDQGRVCTGSIGSAGALPYRGADAPSQPPRSALSDDETTPGAYFWAVACRLASFAFSVAAFLAYAASFRDQPRVLFALACVVTGNFVVTLVHEAGHAITAVALGWRVIAFVVRPFGIQLPNRNLAIVPRRFRAGFGGWITTVPRRREAGTRANWSAILAAGPIASLALAAIAFVASATFLAEAPHRVARLGDFSIDLYTRPIVASGIAIGLGIQSLQACLFAILPDYRDGVTTDGTRWRALRKPGSNYEIYAPLRWLETLLNSKIRLRDRPGWILADVEATPWPTEEVATMMARYRATIEIGTVLDSVPVDTLLARRLIDRFRAVHGTSHWLAGCDAWLAAAWEDDPDRARAVLAEHPGLSDIPQMTLAAEAAVAAREGDAAIAHARLDAMDKEIARSSPFRDLTFRDLRGYVETLLAETMAAQA